MKLKYLIIVMAAFVSFIGSSYAIETGGANLKENECVTFADTFMQDYDRICYFTYFFICCRRVVNSRNTRK